MESDWKAIVQVAFMGSKSYWNVIKFLNCGKVEIVTTFSNGCLGSRINEERSEMRYVRRIAKPSESLRF